MTQNKEPKFKRGCTADLAEYFLEHKGEVVTIAALERAFKGKWSRIQLFQTLSKANSMRKANTNPTLKRIERITTGVWRLDSSDGATKEAPEQHEVPTGHEAKEEAKDASVQLNHGQMLVDVLAERANFILVEDTNDGKIYKMYLVG